MIDLLLPGSLTALMLALAVGVALMYTGPHLRRWARPWLTVVVCGHLFLATQIGYGLWAAPLMRHGTFLTSAADAQGATAVVVLTPGTNTFRARGVEMSVFTEAYPRLLEGVRVYRLLGDPWVILQGGAPDLTDRPAAGDVAKEVMVRLGVPPDRIIVEPRSRNTYEHTIELRPLLTGRNIGTFVLVTGPEHMWRSASTFRTAGYSFVTSASAAHSELPSRRSRWLPHADQLRATAAASHEHVGLLYYWLRGWR